MGPTKVGPSLCGRSIKDSRCLVGSYRERPKKLPSPSHRGQEDLEIQIMDWQLVNKAQGLQPGPEEQANWSYASRVLCVYPVVRSQQ